VEKSWEFHGWREYCEAPWDGKSLGVGVKLEKNLQRGRYG